MNEDRHFSLCWGCLRPIVDGDRFHLISRESLYEGQKRRTHERCSDAALIAMDRLVATPRELEAMARQRQPA